MSEQFGRKFIDALWKLEEANEIDPLVALFADSCEVGNVVAPRTFEGKEGAHAFWRTYRETLGDVKSEFRNVIATGDRVALEWTTTGANAEGKRIDYDGVSILEVEGEQIVRFWAYFDPAKLGQEIRG
ncbi:MAG: nuclear transport factor 2 family protein [Thermomicrobiales bacterium]